MIKSGKLDLYVKITENGLKFFSDEIFFDKKLVSLFLKFNSKYPNFGAIISNIGIFVNSNFPVRKITTVEQDLYYQYMDNGILCIKDEFISYF